MSRSRIIKTAVVLFLVICMVWLMFSGCESQLAADTGINAPITMKYTVSNPLTYVDVREGGGSSFDYHYVTVSGLKDKEIEQAVNNRIKEVYDGLRIPDIPPYRGIKAAIPAASILSSESVAANVAGNFNNILSVVFYKYATYQDPNSQELEKDKKDKNYYDESRYFSEVETLNFDLNTGREIKLSDLFCDNVDQTQLINDYFSRFLAENYADDEGYYPGGDGELKLVESFKGLSEDQRFAIYPFGISFLFDYRTPQFETGRMAVNLPVNFSGFGDNVAVTKRFYDAKVNIYDSIEPPVKALIMKDYINDITGNTYRTEGAVNIYQSWGYSSSLPKEIKSKLKEMREVDRSKVEELKEICSKLPPGTEESPGGWGAYEVMVYAGKVGNYINISKNTNIYMPDSSRLISEYRCYDDGDTLKELTLSDLFKADYDYKPVVIGAIQKAVKDDTVYADPAAVLQISDQQIEDIYNKISGFNLGTEALIIPFENPETAGKYYGTNFCILYKDIGCDNMTIF